jgi:CelD/BcsL family acetyltransferase involved in cellulose biosynthesis
VSAVVALPFTLGARTLFAVKRRLVRRPLTLADVLAGAMPDLPPLAPDSDGYLVTSLPAALADELTAAHPSLSSFVRSRYRRHFLLLDQSFDAYFGAFSGRTRSSLKRKLRRFADRSGGTLDLRSYSRPEEMAEFHRHARAVSALSYQERLLDAGLPEDSLPRLVDLARRDMVRCWVLFLEGRPVSYLHAPADGDTLIYAHLGYDPAVADLSAGTVLHVEAIRQLMDESRFRLFDFTEGEGAHKSRFASGAVECVDLLLLRPRFGNIAAARSLAAFDAAVAAGKRAASRLGLERLARSFLR